MDIREDVAWEIFLRVVPTCAAVSGGLPDELFVRKLAEWCFTCSDVYERVAVEKREALVAAAEECCAVCNGLTAKGFKLSLQKITVADDEWDLVRICEDCAAAHAGRADDAAAQTEEAAVRCSVCGENNCTLPHDDTL